MPHLLHDGISDGFQVDVSLVRQVVEDVSGSDGLGSSLLVAEHQIYPLMQLTRYKLRLQSLKVIRLFIIIIKF